ncbi:hypothetical protein ACFFJY_09225 [Fictibacillus aquaticus]|uniref:hypothetical protein n=1 Tax=Fictibacillus aquaticus TaxID=2021314 RepID=UPI0013FDC43E|nr:hypothetical protein [Fictibacillus aquaticus]
MNKQDEILTLIRKQEAEIEQLLETKSKEEPGSTLYIVAERVALAHQVFIEELRTIL